MGILYYSMYRMMVMSYCLYLTYYMISLLDRVLVLVVVYLSIGVAVLGLDTTS